MISKYLKNSIVKMVFDNYNFIQVLFLLNFIYIIDYRYIYLFEKYIFKEKFIFSKFIDLW